MYNYFLHHFANRTILFNAIVTLMNKYIITIIVGIIQGVPKKERHFKYIW